MPRESTKSTRYVGLGSAVALTGYGAARLLRMAMLGEIEYKTTDDGRVILSRDDVQRVTGVAQPVEA